MLSRRGIAYNLEQSPYKIDKVYGDNKITFKFSSQLYINKFNERCENNRKSINESISKMFKIDFSNDILCDLKLYSDIEKRGFYVFIDGRGCNCLSNIKLDGLSKIRTS